MKNTDDSAHRAIHDEIKAAHAAVMALDPDDESPEAHALGEAQARAVRKIATLPLGGAGEFFVGLAKGDGPMVVHALWRNRRRVAQFEHRPDVLNEGLCIIVKPDVATAERKAARAAERDRQRAYMAALSDVAQFLWNHPKAATWLAVRAEVAHLYDAPFVVGLEHKSGPRGGTVALTGCTGTPVSARGALRSAARGFPWLGDAVFALRTLALQEAVAEAEAVCRGLHEDNRRGASAWLAERIHHAERHLDAISHTFASCKGDEEPGWEARAFDALAMVGATKIIPF